MKRDNILKGALIGGVVALLALTGTLLFAQENKSYSTNTYFVIAGEKYSMGDMVRFLLQQKNHDIETYRYDASMADSQYKQYQQKFAPYLSTEAGVGRTNYTDDMESIGTGSHQDTWDVSGAVSKAFASGTTITAGLSNTYTNTVRQEQSTDVATVYDGDGNVVTQIYVPDDPATAADDESGYVYPQELPFTTIPAGSKYHSPAIFFKVEQEFLKNGFGINDRKTIHNLENATEMQREMMKYAMAQAASAVVFEFWNLTLANDSYSNAKIKLNETIKVRNIVQENVKLGLNENFEQNYYNALVASARAQVFSSKQTLDENKRRIRTYLNLDENLEIQGKVVFIKVLPKLDKDEILNIALAKRSDYLTAQLELKSARLSVDIYENEALPELTGSATLNSFGQNEKFGDAFSDAVNPTNGNGYDIRLTMTHALDNPQQKTQLRDARFELKKAQISMEKTEREVKDDVATKIDNVKTSYKVYQQARIARAQAGAYYNKMRANLKRGRFTAATVKQGLDSYVDSKQQELQALVAYNIALVQLDLAMNMLFEKYDIDVDQFLAEGIQ